VRTSLRRLRRTAARLIPPISVQHVDIIGWFGWFAQAQPPLGSRPDIGSMGRAGAGFFTHSDASHFSTKGPAVKKLEEHFDRL
jgi:hypothetical protein